MFAMSGEYIGSFKTVWTNYACLFFYSNSLPVDDFAVVVDMRMYEDITSVSTCYLINSSHYTLYIHITIYLKGPFKINLPVTILATKI
jgi:hypothetical protein